MSSLIFFIDESQVVLATDTLATNPDGTPFKFTTKAFIVPHLRMLMATTGVLGFLSKWFALVNDKLIVHGIDILHDHAQPILNDLWAQYEKDLTVAVPDDLNATIYHFGFSENTGEMRAYAYRRKNGFCPERFEQHGFFAKPECTQPSTVSGTAEIVAMMNEQREIQARKPIAERVHVGGEIEVHYLSKGGFRVLTLHRFEDYEEVNNAMYDNV